MPYTIEKSSPLNITLLYDELSLADLDRTAIRNILGREGIVPFDTPEMLLMVSSPTQINVQARNRRLIVIDQNSETSVDQSRLPILAAQLHQTVEGSNLVAYGFNYQLGVEHEGEEIPELLKRVFVPNLENIERLVGGEVRSAKPRIAFTRGDINYSLQLSFVDGVSTRLDLFFNAHFDADALPDGEELAFSFVAQYGTLREIIDRLLGE